MHTFLLAPLVNYCPLLVARKLEHLPCVCCYFFAGFLHDLKKSTVVCEVCVEYEAFLQAVGSHLTFARG